MTFCLRSPLGSDESEGDEEDEGVRLLVMCTWESHLKPDCPRGMATLFANSQQQVASEVRLGGKGKGRKGKRVGGERCGWECVH